jgi:hypothetical protein
MSKRSACPKGVKRVKMKTQDEKDSNKSQMNFNKSRARKRIKK